jgi:hypothetical protein
MTRYHQHAWMIYAMQRIRCVNLATIVEKRKITIRTPYAHDVLFGRGVPFYRHVGNVQFRAWVSERSTSYILASNEMKASIVREVIVLVQNQNPPGRFLKRDPAHAGWWVETDDGSAVKKTKEVLRKGDKTDAARCEEALEETESRGEEDGEAGHPIDETIPRGVRELCNADQEVRETAPIHSPHLNDIIIGHACSSPFVHERNFQFRAWVVERSRSYRIASNNEEKRRLAREILALVQNQNPPCRFLHRDPANVGWWMEVDNDQAMEMTCMVLCRMADQAAHCEELEEAEPSEQDELERLKKRVRFDLNGTTVHPNYETLPLMCLTSSPGIATVDARRVEPSTIPPEIAVQQPQTYSLQIMSVSIKLESMAKEMQTWAQLVNCTEGTAQHECIQKVSSLSQEMRTGRLQFDELSILRGELLTRTEEELCYGANRHLSPVLGTTTFRLPSLVGHSSS